MFLSNRFGATIFAASCAALLSSCYTQSDGHAETGGRGQVDVAASVKITENGSGGYDFGYQSPNGDAKGNFDFSKVADAVKITFSIDPASAGGLRFMSSGRDAMWIVDKKAVGDGSPRGPYQGGQFVDFQTSADGRTLSVLDLNTDRTNYRYSLRFDLNGSVVADDPDIKNGGDGN